MNDNRLIVFDTTLRDGEQSPGASMNLAEKLEIARALTELGVDIIEAGFPIASPGDFEAVQSIARQVHGPVICGLARCNDDAIDRAWEAPNEAPTPCTRGPARSSVRSTVWASEPGTARSKRSSWRCGRAAITSAWARRSRRSAC